MDRGIFNRFFMRKQCLASMLSTKKFYKADNMPRQKGRKSAGRGSPMLGRPGLFKAPRKVGVQIAKPVQAPQSPENVGQPEEHVQPIIKKTKQRCVWQRPQEWKGRSAESKANTTSLGQTIHVQQRWPQPLQQSQTEACLERDYYWAGRDWW